MNSRQAQLLLKCARFIAVLWLFPLSTILSFLDLTSASAEAQVVYTLGVQELYDENIFLENDKGAPPAFVLDDQLVTGQPVAPPPHQANGDPDSDFLTNVYVGASGALPVSEHLRTSAEGKVGGIFFADESDEDRITVDGLITATTKETLIPNPFFVSLSTGLESRANNVTAAEGTATKQSETFVGNFIAGSNDYQLGQATKGSTGYTFTYSDFLGNFTFGDNHDDEAAEEFDNRFRERGSDYFTNALDTSVTQTLSDKTDASVYLGVTDYVFTKVQSNDLDDKDEEDLDRLEGRTGVGMKHIVNDKVETGANIGLNYNHYKSKPQERTSDIINSEGLPQTIDVSTDQNSVELTFGGHVAYAPEKLSSIRLAAEQGAHTDVDGDRILSRSVTLDGSKAFGDRFRLTAGGRFFQYNIGDDLSDPTDRYEFTLASSYSLTESISVTAGWNYANQKADANGDQEFFGSDTYEVNRFFVGLTGGLVGLSS